MYRFDTSRSTIRWSADPDPKAPVLELAILGNLKQAPVHGYELKKRLADTLGPLWGVSFGSLYPALRRLERSGAIEVVDAQDDAPTIPSTGSLRGEAATARLRLAPKPSRRARKAYRITARGEALFSELLQRRRAELADRLARSRRNRTPAIDRYTRSLAEHRTDSVERDLAWIDALIDGERPPAPPTEPTDRPQEQEQGATA